ncbi:MAG TPA: ABC transporter permease subunit [Bdellovibrionota bacterium]|jgi:ABC-type transport system involved in multi-copper enzyme maturation permease subunit|nr:ABC transporter permease subunit [Bdellovibrionota bacterium]
MIKVVFELARWRFFLLRKQKIFLTAMVLGVLALLLSLAVASSSYLVPVKIYWDFVLGFVFVAASFLAVYASTGLFSDEKQRRTLHLLLAAGITRRAWVWGNYFGVLAAHIALVLLWSLLAGAFAWFLPDANEAPLLAIVSQAQGAFVMELFILAAMGFCFSFFLRPVLALIATLALTLFLHSQISLLTVLADQQTGAFNTPVLQPILQWIVPFLPPLEWYDLRLLVGYESSTDITLLVKLSLMALAWMVFWVELGVLRFRKIDL